MMWRAHGDDTGKSSVRHNVQFRRRLSQWFFDDVIRLGDSSYSSREDCT